MTLKIGDKVKLVASSHAATAKAPNPSNPLESEGKVIGENAMGVWVKWGNGCENLYLRCDGDLVKVENG